MTCEPEGTGGGTTDGTAGIGASCQCGDGTSAVEGAMHGTAGLGSGGIGGPSPEADIGRDGTGGTAA